MRIPSVGHRTLFPLFSLFLMSAFLGVGVLPAEDAADLLTLDHAVQTAMENNRSLRIASLEVDRSKWQVADTKTKRLPATTAYRQPGLCVFLRDRS